MKTTISRSLLVFASVLTLGYTRAAEPVGMPTTSNISTNVDNINSAKMERELDRALSRNIAYPLFERSDMTGEVVVSLVVDKEGKLVVLECNSTNAELKAYVLRKLSRIDIGENPDGMWKTTHIRFNFRPQNG